MFTTKRLCIKSWSLDLAQAFHELSQDRGFTLFPINNYHQPDVASAQAWIEQQTKPLGKYAVFEKETSKLIGMGGLTPWHWEGEELIDITYRLRESAWGKGYGLELAQALVDYGFHTLQLKEISATITPDNLPSKKIAEKLGMTLERPILLLNVQTDLYRLKKAGSF